MFRKANTTYVDAHGIEKNGTKIAAILCIVSAFPLVGEIYAKASEEGWHGDSYIEDDKKVKGWTEIDGKHYYFDETGELDKEKSYNASSATVKPSIKSDIKDTIATAVQERTETQQAEDEPDTNKTVSSGSENPLELENTANESATSDAADSNMQAQDIEQVQVQTDEIQMSAGPDPNAQTKVFTDSQSVASDTASENNSENKNTGNSVDTDNIEQLSADNQAAVANKIADEIVDESVNTESDTSNQEETAQADTDYDSTVTDLSDTETSNTKTSDLSVSDTNPADSSNSQSQNASNNLSDDLSSLNSRIAAAALAEVGTTDGQQCTDVATGALTAAGVSASVVWPDEYVQYGYYVSADEAQAGNLIYYANGGTGAAHIGVYVGNGQAVQGNFNGKTILARADLSSYGTGASQAQYIQITG